MTKHEDGLTDLNKKNSQLSTDNIIKLSLMLQNKILARFVPCITFHPPGPTLTTMTESQAGFLLNSFAGVDFLVRSRFREYKKKSCIILPATDKRTQCFPLIFREPEAHHKFHPCSNNLDNQYDHDSLRSN